MGRYLMLDIGAGTLDMLYYDTDRELLYKAVITLCPCSRSMMNALCE